VIDPGKDVKPYHDNVWVLKRVGLALLAFYVALPVAPVLETVGAPHAVVVVYVLGAILLFFAATGWWFVQDSRREKRRKAAIRALRSGDPIEQPVLVAPRSARQRMSSYAMLVGLVVVSFGVPLIVIGAVARIVALRDVGFALIAVELLLLAIVLPRLSAKRHRQPRHPTSGNPEPS
jgi:hypothetical protein